MGHVNGATTIDVRASSLASSDPIIGTVSGQLGPGYARHEIEGIGGVVKKKLVRMVWVGACVTEWEDEKERGSMDMGMGQGHTRSFP
jgi:hypothetical protein